MSGQGRTFYPRLRDLIIETNRLPYRLTTMMTIMPDRCGSVIVPERRTIGESPRLTSEGCAEEGHRVTQIRAFRGLLRPFHDIPRIARLRRAGWFRFRVKTH
jgi:hypothetical protein